MNYISELSIAGVGFLGAYELGALEALDQLGLVSISKTQLSAASSGSLIVGHYCAGVSFPTIYQADYAITYYCAVTDAPFECLYALTATESVAFNTTFSGISNATIATQCANTYIQLTQVTASNCSSSTPPTITGGLLVGGFTNVEDLKNAMLGSSFLPKLSEDACYFNYNGENVIDGGFSNDAPCKGGNCVVISGEPKPNWRGYTADIYPGVDNGKLPTGMSLANFSNSLYPSSIYPYYNALYLQGQADAQYWASINFPVK